MAGLLNKMLNFVGWEFEEEEQEENFQETKEEEDQTRLLYTSGKKQQGKVVNIHSSAQFKIIVMQPESFEDAQDICDHLKNKKPIIVNFEDVEKEAAQRIIDFLSGAVYSLDGDIQKVSNNIFLIAPHNVDIMGDFKDETGNRSVFPWMK